MSVQPTIKSFLGVGLEATKGTPVVSTAMIPITIGTFKPVDHIAELIDGAVRGSMVEEYNYIQGRKWSELDWGGPVFSDTFGFLLASILGDVVTTGASAPYSHAIATKNSVGTAGDAQPKGVTLNDYYSAANRQYAGCQCVELEMTFNADGMLEYVAKVIGYPSGTASAPTLTVSGVLPTAVWAGSATIAGSSISNTVTGMVKMTRKYATVFTVNGTQAPFAVFVGGLTVESKLSFIMEDDSQLLNYLNNTQPTITYSWATGSGATATSIAFSLAKAAYVTGAPDRSKDMVEVMVDIKGLGNTTNIGASAGYSPIKWTITNANPSGTYQ